MKFIEEAMPYTRESWHTAAIVTPASTLHVLYKQEGKRIVCIRIESKEIELEFADTVMDAVDDLPAESLAGEFGLVESPLAPKGALGYVSGSARKLARGWASDDFSDVTQVFPCAKCELNPRWKENKFISVMRQLRVFLPNRGISPYVEVRLLSRGPSKLSIPAWTHVPIAQVNQYVSILAKEAGSEVSIRNIAGEELSLLTPADWSQAETKIAAHALLDTQPLRSNVRPRL